MSINSNTNNPNNPLFWDSKYKTDNIGWDIGCATPIFTHYFKKLSTANKKILIPGSGNGHDAIYLAELGFEVYTVDFSKVANHNLITESKMKGLSITVITEDFFNLNNYDFYFDIILEYTFFCAINPERRNEYIKKIYSLLKSNGMLVGIFLPLIKDSKVKGPPFTVNIETVNNQFSKYFKNITFKKSKFSIKPRKNNELFFTMEKH